MYLSLMDKEVSVKEPKKERIAWKIMHKSKNNKEYCFPFFNKNRFAKNKWIKARNILINTYEDSNDTYYTTYTSGFHVFPTRKIARMYKKYYVTGSIVKVLVKEITTTGVQDGQPCWVAQYIKFGE